MSLDNIRSRQNFNSNQAENGQQGVEIVDTEIEDYTWR